jgi:hypothetical protein
MDRDLLSWQEKKWAYDRWCEGYSAMEISEALYVCEKTVQRVLKGKDRTRPILHYDFTQEGRRMNPEQTSAYFKGMEDGHDYARNEWHIKPPEDFGGYLITFTAILGGRRSKRLIDISEYDGTWDVAHIERYGYKDIKILAWMELPEAYKG